MRTLLLIIAGLFLITDAVYANKDSVGVKTVGGKMFILHKVTKGEGMYGIGRKYGATPVSIQQANPTAKNGISPGQVIMVPYIRNAKNASAAPAKKAAASKQVNKPAESKTQATVATRIEKSPIYHTVTPGETMYRVAKNHKIQVADITKWNGIKGNEISVGQKIIVGYTTKQVAATPEKVLPDGTVKTAKPASKEEVAVKENHEKPQTENKAKKGDYIDKKYEDQYVESQKLPADNNKKGKSVWKEVQESGVASWIDDGSVVTEKKLALHKTAPVGTVIKLKNPMNDAVVFVKVIGRLPQDNSEDNVLIKITKSTADKLGLRDKYSRLEMNYGMEVTK